MLTLFFIDSVEKYRLTSDDAKKINKILYKVDIIDDEDKITEKGKEQIAQGTMPLPENLEQYRASMGNLLKSIYTESAFKPEDERATIALRTNGNFMKREFQELWNKISLKTIYEVHFDTPKLIGESALLINRDLHIADMAYEVKTGEQKREGSKQELDGGTHFTQSDRERFKLKTNPYYNTVYDIVGEIEHLTNLTRRTITSILQKISPDKFYLLRKNPEEFIAKCGKIINEAKATLIINNIAYHKMEERHDVKTVFTNDNTALRSTEVLKKHIYDYMTSDSKTESEFAKALEQAVEVVVYAKLPKSFYITTPVGRYSPDWAIVFDKEKVRYIYFVVETKGSNSSLDSREVESLKIHCAQVHFEEIAGSEVRYEVINGWDKLMELVQLK